MLNFLRSLFHLPPFYRVADVKDGDTIKLDNGWDVRIRGIDAPELGQPGGPEAKVLLTWLLKQCGNRVTLHNIALDKYGRYLATVRTGAGDISDVMIREGSVHRYMDDKGLYIKQEEWSKRKRKGVHSKRGEKPKD